MGSNVQLGLSVGAATKPTLEVDGAMFDKIFDVNVKMCPGLRVFDFFLSAGAHAFLSEFCARTATRMLQHCRVFCVGF